MSSMDFRDWFVAGSVTAMLVAATFYLWQFHSDANFGIWAGLCATLIGAYHMINVRDDKTRDAQ